MTDNPTSPRRGGWFASRSVGATIGAVVALLAVVVLATNALAAQRLSLLRDSQETTSAENPEPLAARSGMQRAHAGYPARTPDHVAATPVRREERIGERQDEAADLEAGFAGYEPYTGASEARAGLGTARTAGVDRVETDLISVASRGDPVAPLWVAVSAAVVAAVLLTSVVVRRSRPVPAALGLRQALSSVGVSAGAVAA